jgi:hypothetical protein
MLSNSSESIITATPVRSRLTSPAEASAVPRAMQLTEAMRRRVGLSRPATKRESMVMIGVKACRGKQVCMARFRHMRPVHTE